MSESGHTLSPAIAFALLAAGSSRRAGGGKLEFELGGKALAFWAAEAAERAGFQSRYLILASDSDPDFGLADRGWARVVNPAAETGIASSIRAAVSAATDRARLVIALADMPFVSSDHLRTVALGKGATFTRYPSGRNGVPAGFDREEFGRLDALQGDAGAASRDWDAAGAISPVIDDELVDVDTIQDLERARHIAARR